MVSDRGSRPSGPPYRGRSLSRCAGLVSLLVRCQPALRSACLVSVTPCRRRAAHPVGSGNRADRTGAQALAVAGGRLGHPPPLRHVQGLPFFPPVLQPGTALDIYAPSRPRDPSRRRSTGFSHLRTSLSHSPSCRPSCDSTPSWTPSSRSPSQGHLTVGSPRRAHGGPPGRVGRRFHRLHQ